MDCKQASSLIHDYLDDDLKYEQAMKLKKHFKDCSACHERFKELERTEMTLFASMKQRAISAPEELAERIMSRLPRQRKQQAWIGWIKRHPALTAAALFMFVMLFSAVSLWETDDQLVVKTSDSDQVIINGNTVIVPDGATVAGNLTVENGKAEIYGDVQGNLTVIDGSYYQASTAHIAGEIKSIDQALDWIWYRITNLFSDVAYR